jgi:hypothetical protein
LAVLAPRACGGLANQNASRHDERTFPYTGKALTIVSTNTILSITTGGAGDVKASRTVSGNAVSDGNATWALQGDTLTLTTTCSGLVINCGGRDELRVPDGVALTLRDHGGSVAVNGLAAPLTASGENATLTVADSSGPLQLSTTGSGDIVATGTRSTQVSANAANGVVRLAFATQPDQVKAVTDIGNVDVTLPGEGYQVVCTSGKGKADSAVPNTPGSPRGVTAQSDNGNVAIHAAQPASLTAAAESALQSTWFL